MTEGAYKELFPRDFGERPARPVEIASLTWEEFSERRGVGCDRVTEWRGGAVPTAGEPYLVYDGACGTGGMLTVAEETLEQLAGERGKDVSVHLYGQEVCPPSTFS